MAGREDLTPEKQMELAEQTLIGWRFLLDSMDGQVAEALRHGWSEDHARELVLEFTRMQFASLSRQPQPPVA